ncbi:MAG: polysaccharide pyruvyl transferase family protein [Oscillospiraceae bacterium]|nr:polysaccharide pyruvyl transferase family protein [Oscillospiraceae bacterium]
MKAAIMTLALSDNYGAALQCYGLSKALTDMGVDNELYRYQNWARITYGMSAVSRIKYEGLKAAKLLLTGGERAKRFTSFRETYIPMTKKLYENNDQLRQQPGDYDVYISGSDQIWNPRLFVFDYSYFLDFVPAEKKKISFASSFGKAGFEESYKEKCGKLLNEYSHISVREKSGETIVKELCGKDAVTSLDPTLLLTKEDWMPLTETASQKAKNFNGILCYIMPGDSLVEAAIEKLAQQLHEKTGLPIMRLGIKEHKVFSYKKDEVDIKAGPADFLAYFAGAKYVVTNSFHGTAFSVNFGKEAYIPINDTLPPEKALHERVKSLLAQVDGEALMVPASNPTLRSQALDQEKIAANLNALRQESKDYLKRALEL